MENHSYTVFTTDQIITTSPPRSKKYLEKWVNTVGVVGFMANLHLGVKGSS